MEGTGLFCHIFMSQSTKIREVKVIGYLTFVNCRQYMSLLIICERRKKETNLVFARTEGGRPLSSEMMFT